MSRVSPNSRATRTAARRAVRARHRERGPLGFNLTPMIDVTFNLLIYFVVTTSFLQAEGLLPSRMVRLGNESAGQIMPVTPIRIFLAGDAEDDAVSIRLENTARIPRSFGDLYQVLGGLRGGGTGFDATTPVVIHAEDTVAWDHVVNAFNAAKRAGFETISFGKARRRG